MTESRPDLLEVEKMVNMNICKARSCVVLYRTNCIVVINLERQAFKC